MKKILITGGFGYLGGRLAQFLASRSDYEIYLGSRSRNEAPSWLPQVRVVQNDWDSQEALEKNCANMEVIIHLAGMNAQDCAADPVAALEVNAVATARLLQAAMRRGVKRFVYLSTAHVYASSLSGKIAEDTEPSNLHPYATSHRAGEDAVRLAHQRREIEGIVIRQSNSFGAPTDKSANCWMLLVNDLCRQAVATHCMSLQSSGLQRRNFIALNDACAAIEHLVNLSENRLDDGLFNIGSHWNPTILEMAERIADRFYVVTGRRPELSCKTDSTVSTPEFLDYQINKLLNTGFCLGNSTDMELDGLIKFCRGL